MSIEGGIPGHQQRLVCPNCGKVFFAWRPDELPGQKVKCYFCKHEFADDAALRPPPPVPIATEAPAEAGTPAAAETPPAEAATPPAAAAETPPAEAATSPAAAAETPSTEAEAALAAAPPSPETPPAAEPAESPTSTQ